MKVYRHLLLVIIAILTFITPLIGCKKVEQKIEYYSGPETIYPENMPIASTGVPDYTPPTKGYIDASYVNLTLEMMLSPEYSDLVDSWYRITIDKTISQKEASNLNGYEGIGGTGCTFYEATLWYDYIRNERLEKKIVIYQSGTTEWQHENQRLFTVGESYLVLLGIQFTDWDFVGVYMPGYNTYQILYDNSKDVAIQYIETFPEFNELRINNTRLNNAGYYVYDLTTTVEALKNLYSAIVKENDKYNPPAVEEYYWEYKENKKQFKKETND